MELPSHSIKRLRAARDLVYSAASVDPLSLVLLTVTF